MPDSDPQTLPRRPRLEFPGSQRVFYWSLAAIGVALFGGLFKLMTNPTLGLLILAVMGACLWATLKSMREGATYLAFDPECLTFSIRFAKQVIKWKDIKSILIGWLGVEQVQMRYNRQVFIDCSNRANAMQIFPPIFGLSAEQLVDLMQPYHEDSKRDSETQDPSDMSLVAVS
jgi:hypothetical protein